MILILFISYLIESGLDSVYYRFVPIDTNIFVPELKTTEEGGIFLTGTKSFTVNYGKEGLAFDQGMWINFEGRSGDVTVNGSISDEEGTGEVTRPLFEVENTRIGFAAPWGRGDFGDLDLYHHLNLGNYNQKGIGAELGIGPVSGGLLVSRGHYHQKRVFSEDHQGPYTVDDQGIIPGTEEVFLDGELMVKGVDYLIDYEGGTITFTPRQVITPIRRIEVRYLSGDLRFMKISSFSSARFKGNELGFILDDENKERTIDIDLSDEEIAHLRSSGDSAVWIDGGDTITGGDYVKVGDHYEFAGFGKGNYQVWFTYVGGDSGDYIYDDSLHAYRYTGGGGDYVARLKITPPKANRVFYYRTEPKIGPVMINIEPSISYTDQNLFSRYDDDDNVGYGLGGNLNYDGPFDLRFNFIIRDDNYRFPLASYYDLSYTWGLDSLVDLQSLYEVKTVFDYDRFDILLSGGILNRHWPKAGIGLLVPDGHVTYTRFLKRFRFDGGIAHTYGPVTPGIDLLLEDDRSIAKVKVKGYDIIKVSYETIKDTMGDGRVYHIGLSPSIGLVRGEAIWNLSRWEGKTWDLVHLLLNLVRPVSLSTSFNLTQEKVRRYDEYYVRVKPGQGDYRLDTLTGRYIYDPGGDYIREIHYLDESDLTKKYLGTLLLRHDYGSLNLSYDRDDQKTEIRSGGDISIHLTTWEPTSNWNYRRKKDPFDDETDIDLEAGPYLYLSPQVKIGPFGHLRRSYEVSDFGVIRREITNGGKMRISLYKKIGLDAFLGYDLISVESPVYFPEVGKIEIQNPLLGLNLSIPIGRFQTTTVGDLSYIRARNLEGFLTILYPPGLTANYQVRVEHRLGARSTIGVGYRGRYHPEYRFDHNLNFSTRIRF